jgi:hypothetical protein
MFLRAPFKPRTILTWLGLLFGVLGLLLTLLLPLNGTQGNDSAQRLGTGFGSFALALNAALLLTYFTEVAAGIRLRLFAQPVTRAVLFGLSAATLVYVFLQLGAPSDYAGTADIAQRLAYYLCPALYIMWWVMAPNHGALRWTEFPVLLAPIALYLAYALVQATTLGQSPYPFLGQVFAAPTNIFNALGAALIFAAAYAGTIALDGVLARAKVNTDVINPTSD